MYIERTSFSARSAVAVCLSGAVLVVLVAALSADGQATDAQGCRVECYPNTKAINGKGGVGKGENCRWILRTDGKAARLCDHIKCRKICPQQQAAHQAAQAAQAQDQQVSAASDNMRVEQQTEAESPNSATGQQTSQTQTQAQQQQQQQQPMGIMRKLHGQKLAQAPVPGVSGGRLAQQPAQQPQPQQQPNVIGGRRMAPTMPPAVQYDENDTPPPISRFLDISPEE